MNNLRNIEDMEIPVNTLCKTQQAKMDLILGFKELADKLSKAEIEVVVKHLDEWNKQR